MSGHQALIKKILILVFFAILGSLFFKSVFDETGLIRGQRLRTDCERKLVEAARLEQENQELRNEIIELRKDKSRRLEMLSRSEFGMAKPGEIVFSFPDTQVDSNSAP